MLIINDKRSDLVTKTFFHHNQPANSAVVIIERMNLLKAYMEIQDGIYVHGLFFIGLNQLNQLAMNVFRHYAQFMWIFSIFTDTNLMFLIRISTVGQTVMVPSNQLR